MRFAAKVLTGLPSILAGVFAFAVVVVVTGEFSAPAGGVALALLMLPTVLLTAEEAIKRVPSRMREAAIGMGATPTQVVTKVIVPTARSRDADGRHAGGGARRRRNRSAAVHRAVQQFLDEPDRHLIFCPRRLSDLMKPTASLAVLIYNFSGSPFENQIATGVDRRAGAGGDRSGVQHRRPSRWPDDPPTS